MHYDVIIVGGGLGGLTSGAKLAREGKKVLLLEQHDRPGGCATTFKRKDFTMEVGLHEMDGLHPSDPKTKIFQDLGVFDKVEFLELPEFYRFVNGRHDIVIPHNPELAIKRLLQVFPEEENGINAYFEHLLNARKILKERRGKEDTSIGDFLDEIINNDDLKLVLLGNLGYFHDDPYTLSFSYYLNAQGAYYNGRANFVKGGSQKLSNALAEIIEENGGEVKLNHLVSGIIYENGVPSAVQYHKKEKTADKEFKDTASEIIINAALPNAVKKMIPAEHAGILEEQIDKMEIGASLLTVYYGFNKSLTRLGNKNYSTFFYDPSVKSQSDILVNNHSDFDTRSFTFVDYGQVDSGLAPEGKSVGAVCCIDYPADWENLSPQEYKNKKAEAGEKITERCEMLIPGFRDAIEYMEVATSLSVRRYTLNPGGAVYGFAQLPGKKTDYLNNLPSNLHVASAWGKLGGGFSGAIISGYMTAYGILRKRG
jgi:phytoene dehydrogenase-like protein